MIALVLVLACATGVDPRVSEAQTLAAHGEDDAALAGLQSVLHDVEDSGGSGSAALHFNIGTLALRTGDNALAVQHLLSAWRRAPTDDDVVHNLQLAKEAGEIKKAAGAVVVDPVREARNVAKRAELCRLHNVDVDVVEAVFAVLVAASRDTQR